MSRIEELSKYFNISPNCSEVEMYRACRALMVKFHPDKPDGDLEKYNEVCKNFNELINLGLSAELPPSCQSKESN